MELSEASDDEEVKLQKRLKLPFDVHRAGTTNKHHKYQKHLLHPKKA